MTTECPMCGSIETEANTIEAWCYDCEWHTTAEESPEFHATFYQAHKAHRAEMAAIFNQLLAN